MIEVLLVDQLESHLHAGIAARHVLTSAFCQTLVAQVRGLIEGEFEIDRVGRYDGRKQCRVAGRAAGDEIAGRHAPVADAPIHRCAQFGELHIKFRLPHGCLVCAHRRFGIAERLSALLEGLIGDGLVAYKLLSARVVGLREGEIGLRLHQIGARLVESVLERALVDREKQIALLDELSILEVHLVEIA